MNCKIIEIDNIKTLSVKAEMFPEGIGAAFDKLESKLTSLKGLKFYGAAIIRQAEIEYRACFERINDNERYGLEDFIIPGGKYASCRIKDWSHRTAEIRHLFKQMMVEYETDFSRPQVEYYRSQKELILMLPIYA